MTRVSHDLFQPSLTDGWKQTKSYDINRLFLVAFFGGPIPMMVLGTRNAKWLNVPKRHTYLLFVTCVLVLLTNMVVYSMYADGAIALENRMPHYSLRILSVLLFLLYKYVLNKSFQQHLLTIGETEPLLKPGLFWVILGGIVEFAIVGMIFLLAGWTW